MVNVRESGTRNLSCLNLTYLKSLSPCDPFRNFYSP